MSGEYLSGLRNVRSNFNEIDTSNNGKLDTNEIAKAIKYKTVSNEGIKFLENIIYNKANITIQEIDIIINNTENLQILLTSKKLELTTKQLLDYSLVTGIINAENKRKSFLEKINIDGKTIGRGQLSQDAYNDVKKKFESELESFLKINDIFDGKIPKSYSNVIGNQKAEEFIILAYLAIKINERIKDGRSPEDTLKFAIGMYHGGFNSLVIAQNKTNNLINFLPIEPVLNENNPDLLKYINEVYDYYYKNKASE